MRTRAFVEACKREHDALIAIYADVGNPSAVSRLLQDAQLDAAQRDKVTAALATAVTDCFYTILLALNGSASLGGVQQHYRLLDEGGALVSECEDGDLESFAYELFQDRPG